MCSSRNAVEYFLQQTNIQIQSQGSTERNVDPAGFFWKIRTGENEAVRESLFKVSMMPSIGSLSDTLLKLTSRHPMLRLLQWYVV